MSRAPSFPDGARAAVRDFAAADPHNWERAYATFVADIRREVRFGLRSFDPVHGWRGTVHRVLLRNTYADIGITTRQGMATVWITEREDHAFRLRCEWIDLAADARRWLDEIAPVFGAITLRLGCAIHLPTTADPSRWLEAA